MRNFFRDLAVKLAAIFLLFLPILVGAQEIGHPAEVEKSQNGYESGSPPVSQREIKDFTNEFRNLQKEAKQIVPHLLYPVTNEH